MTNPRGEDFRNPVVVPSKEVRRRGCPRCGENDYSGRRICGSSAINFRCLKCGEVWQGGLSQVPDDPLKPTPPLDPFDRPYVDFVKDSRGEVQEVRNPVDKTPDYRRGAPIPSPGEEDV